MDIAAYISANHAHFFYVIAGLSFLVELTLLGLSGPLLFFAIGTFITAVLTSMGLISGWEVETFTLGILTAFTAVLLWKPLKQFQNLSDGSDGSSDMIGKQVPVSKAINQTTGAIRYSGIDWNSRLDEGVKVESIPEGTRCVITSVDGNIMLVKPLT